MGKAKLSGNQNIKTATATEQKSGLITEQKRKIVDNHVLDKPDVVPDNPDTVPEAVPVEPETNSDLFVCPECNKRFSSESSLIHHRLRAHKVAKPKLGGGEGGSIPKREFEAKVREEPIIETEKDELRKFLEKIRFGRVDTVLAFTDQLGFDVEAVYYALRKAYAPKDVLDATISFWALRRGERIPEHIKRELKPPSYERPYLFEEFKKPVYENDAETHKQFQQETELDKVLKIIKIQKELQTSTPNNSPNLSDDRLARLEARIDELSRENAELREKLAEKDKQLLQKELESLKAEIKNLKENQHARSQWDIELKKLDLIDKRLDKFYNLLLAMGRPYPRKAEEYERPTVEESGRYTSAEWVLEEG